MGEVYDVAVDCRPNSKTFGKWVGVTLSAENKKMFYIPEGFAHGFLVLSDVAEFCYKCTDMIRPQRAASPMMTRPSTFSGRTAAASIRPAPRTKSTRPLPSRSLNTLKNTDSGEPMCRI